jgi:hypothetical protein
MPCREGKQTNRVILGPAFMGCPSDEICPERREKGISDPLGSIPTYAFATDRLFFGLRLISDRRQIEDPGIFFVYGD